MLFSEAVAEVLGMVKRPDKTNSIKRELNAAITFFTLEGEWPRDFAEINLAVDDQEYSQAIALSAFERFRKFKYLKRGGTNKHLKVISDTELFMDCDKRDRYYIAGDNVNINNSVLCATMDIGWYKYPPLLTGATSSDTHWMLEVSPFMLIDRAAAAIFKDIGQDKDFDIHRKQAGEAYLVFRKDILSNQ